MLNIQTLTLGPVQTNCYIVSDRSGNCLIIDPGDEDGRILSVLEKRKLKPAAILLTHAHFDHIGAVDALRERFGVSVYLHKKEADWLENPDLNGSGKYAFIPDVRVRPADRMINGEEELEIGPFRMRLFHTPGHSPGSVTFYFPESEFAVVGDTLFKGSIGRTDLAGGSHDVLLDSISRSLLTMPEGTILYPGHGPETTAEEEAETNPFLNRR